MKNKIFLMNEPAVSPVVGVMLMLVVVIIIAALVSAFGGGLMQTDKQAPQASIQGEYSQYYGLTMTHLGGDSLETKNLIVQIRPTDEFGQGQGEFGIRRVNVSTISNGKPNAGASGAMSYWIDPTDGTSAIMSWKPGEIMYVKGGSDLVNSGMLVSPTDYPPCYNEKIQGGKSTSGIKNYCFTTSINNQVNVGKKVYLEIVTTDGKMISTSPMIIQP